MNEPVRILSDLHLGHKISRIEQVSALRPLIAGAATVIFNGDTAQELSRPFLDRSTAMLGELKSLCREEGAEAIFLPGNHDPSWPGPGWIELAEGRIVITHGDALLPAGSPWKREILENPQRVEEIWARHPDAAHDLRERLAVAREIADELCSIEWPTGRHFLQRAWDAIHPPSRAGVMAGACLNQAGPGAKFCADYFPKAELLMIGHFHWSGSWLRDGRRIVNTGSFMSPGRACWAEWNSGWLSWGVIDEAPDLYRKGKTLDVWNF